MVVILRVAYVVQQRLLFIQWLRRSSRQLVQMFPTFTHLQRQQLLLSSHRLQPNTGLQLETGLLPLYALRTVASYSPVTVASYTPVTVASFEFTASNHWNGWKCTITLTPEAGALYNARRKMDSIRNDVTRKIWCPKCWDALFVMYCIYGEIPIEQYAFVCSSN